MNYGSQPEADLALLAAAMQRVRSIELLELTPESCRSTFKLSESARSPVAGPIENADVQAEESLAKTAFAPGLPLLNL